MQPTGRVFRADRTAGQTGILYGNELRRDPGAENSYFPAEYVKESEDGKSYELVPERVKPPDDMNEMLFDNRSAGYKCFNLPDNHPEKRRIPQESVVNRVSDYRQCLVCDYTTAARVLNWANVWAAITMTVLLIVTIDLGYLRGGELQTDLRVQRLSGGWNTTRGSMAALDKAWGLKDQNTPVSLSGLLVTLLCIELFMLLLQLVWGSFERFWYIFWR